MDRVTGGSGNSWGETSRGPTVAPHFGTGEVAGPESVLAQVLLPTPEAGGGQCIPGRNFGGQKWVLFRHARALDRSSSSLREPGQCSSGIPGGRTDPPCLPAAAEMGLPSLRRRVELGRYMQGRGQHRLRRISRVAPSPVRSGTPFSLFCSFCLHFLLVRAAGGMVSSQPKIFVTVLYPPWTARSWRPCRRVRPEPFGLSAYGIRLPEQRRR